MPSELVVSGFLFSLGGRCVSVRLELLKKEDDEQFIKDNQYAFKFGAEQYFNEKELKEQFEENDEIISRETIIHSLNETNALGYRIILNNKKVGGIVISLDKDKGELLLFFVNPNEHSKGIGTKVWDKIEKMYPEVKHWETLTPYFEKRNINFYVNKLGFHIVEFFNKYHPDPHYPDEMDEMLRFEKIIKS